MIQPNPVYEVGVLGTSVASLVGMAVVSGILVSQGRMKIVGVGGGATVAVALGSDRSGVGVVVGSKIVRLVTDGSAAKVAVAVGSMMVASAVAVGALSLSVGADVGTMVIVATVVATVVAVVVDSGMIGWVAGGCSCGRVTAVNRVGCCFSPGGPG